MKSSVTSFLAKNNKRNFVIVFAFLFVLTLISSINVYSQIQIGATNYSSLYNAMNAINNGVHTGAITVMVTNNTTETLIAQLNSGSVPPANYASVTIRPTGNYTISASHGGTILYLNGASNVTIDGSQSIGGTSQNLTFQNNAASATIPNSNGILTSTVYGGCILSMSGSNVTIKNTQLLSAGLTAGWGVNFYSITNGTIDNCLIKRSSLGVLAQLCTNINLTNSVIGSTTSSDMIGFRGICYYGVNTFVIRKNEIVGINFTQTSAAASARAITIHTNSGGGLGTSTNGLIDKNKVHNLRNTVSGAYAIVLQGAVATDDFSTTISNNLVYDIVVGGNFTSAIVLTGAGINTKIYHNTINLYIPSGLTNYQSYAVYILQTNIDFRNNIIMNQMASTNGDYGMVVANAAGVSTFTNIDYNTWVISSTGTKYLSLWSTVFTADATGLASWQTTTAGESHSTISTTPVFVADDNPHLSGTSLTESNLFCSPIPASGNWDNKDYDGETRRAGTLIGTYRGADEVFANLGFSQNITSSPSQAVFCDGSNVTLSFTATIVSYNDGIARTSSVTPTYSWYKSLGSPVLISGQTNSSLTLNNIKKVDSANYFAYAKFLGDSIATNSKLLNIQNPISILSHPVSKALCSTTPFLQLSVVGAGTVTSYQWQRETSPGSGIYQNISGQTTSNMSVPITDASLATGNYRVLVLGSGNCGASSITSNVANVTVADPLINPSATINTPTPGLVCTGSDLQLNAYLTKGTVLGYKWQRFDGMYWADVDITKFPTANQPVLIMKNVRSSESSTYQCLITGSSDCVPSSVATNSIVVKVWDLYQIVEQPVNVLVCNGERVMLSCGGNGKTISYQWQKDGVDIKLSDNSTSQNSYFVITQSQYENSGVYRCKMTIQDCRGIIPIYTDNAVVYITTPTNITEQPKKQNIPYGSVATFAFTAHVNDKKIENAMANGTVSVQWYKMTSETQSLTLSDNMPRISGSKTNYLTISNITQDDLGKYFAEISGLCGNVKTVPAELVLDNLDITIVRQPVGLSNCEATDVIFSIDATTQSSKAIKYQWFKGGNPLTDIDLVINGTQSKNLVIFNITGADSSEYYAKISLEGTQVSKQSDKVLLIVKYKPVIKTQPLGKTLKVNDSLSLIIGVANPSDPNLKYQWYKDSKPIANSTTVNFSLSRVSVSDAGEYYCIATNDCGSITSDKVNVVITTLTATSVLTDVQFNGYSLSVPSPSPVNNSANVRYFIPDFANVKISLSDIEGNYESELVNQMISAGEHFVTINPSKLNISNGTYFLKLESNGVLLVQKVIVVK